MCHVCKAWESNESLPGTARTLRQDLQGQTAADITLHLCEATWTKLIPRWSHKHLNLSEVPLGRPAFEIEGFQFSHQLNCRGRFWILQGSCRLQSLIPKSWRTVLFHIYGTHTMMTHLLSTLGMRICFFLCPVRHKISYGGKAGTVLQGRDRLQGRHSLTSLQWVPVEMFWVVLPHRLCCLGQQVSLAVQWNPVSIKGSTCR